MDRNKKVIGNSLVYVVNNMLIKAFNFLLLPIYTIYLTTEDYGITNIVSAFNNVAIYIIMFCLNLAVIRFYTEYKQDKEKLKLFFGTVICFTFLSGIAFFAICLLIKPVLEKYIFSGIDFFPTVIIALISVMFFGIYTLFQESLKGMQNAKKSAATSILYFLVQLLFNIVFVVKLQLGANGVLLASMITNIIFTTYMFFDLLKQNLFRFCIDKRMIKDLLTYSIPLFPHTMSTHIAQLVSKVFINTYASLSAVGLYSVASQFGVVADIIQVSVNTAFKPWFFERMKLKEVSFQKQVVDLTNMLLWIYGFLFLGLALFSQEAILIMCNESYAAAWTVVPLIVVLYIIKTPYYFFINVLFYYKKAIKYIFTATVFGSIINIIFSYFLIKSYGMYGTVMADGIAMIFRVAIIVYLSLKFDKVGYRVARFIINVFMNIGFICLGLALSYTFFRYKVSPINIIYKMAIVLLYMSIALYCERKKFSGVLLMLKNISKK
jgi:O-antigen/teichoic acid export membrane protein